MLRLFGLGEGQAREPVVDSANSGCADAVEGSDVSYAEAKEELERILSDPEFHCTDRHRKFLRFVTEELVQGRGAAVKAYSIAADVFGRPPSFDPSVDPIVRIEASRLRRRSPATTMSTRNAGRCGSTAGTLRPDLLADCRGSGASYRRSHALCPRLLAPAPGKSDCSRAWRADGSPPR